MRTTFAFALAMLLGTSAAASAQTTASDDALVTLDVLAALSLTKTADLDLGIVNPSAGAVSVSPQTGTNAGRFTASGNAGSSILVTFVTPSVTLTNGSDNLTFTPSLSGADAAGSQATSAAVNDGDAVTLNGSGSFFFWLGGSVNVGAVSTGTYTGTFTLQVAYN